MTRHHSNSSATGGSRRVQRVEREMVQACSRLLSKELAGLNIPTQSITVSHVSMSPDLRNAMVFVSPLGGDMKVADLVTALNAHQKHLRHEFRQYIELKYMPKLKFMADESFERSMYISDLMETDRVKNDIV